MTDTRGKTDSNDACTEFVHSTVSVIPSLLERLIFLASLRAPDTGEYHDRAIEALLTLKFGNAESGLVRRHEQVVGLPWGKAELDRALRHEHLAVFDDWLCLDLRHQTAELEGYASSQDIPASALSRKWIDEQSYEGLIPSDSIPVQRQLFRTDMETVLATLLVRTLGDQ